MLHIQRSDVQGYVDVEIEVQDITQPVPLYVVRVVLDVQGSEVELIAVRQTMWSSLICITRRMTHFSDIRPLRTQD